MAAETAESPDRAPALQPRAGESPAATGDMVRVPAGPFFMGCNETVDRECDDDEKPGRTVTAAAFRIDRTEVTVAAYQACVAAGGCSEPGDSGSCTWGKAGQENHPINCIDWEQARAYCAWAGKRLPTAAEWEKAARGTDGRKYPGGNEEPENRMANLGGSHDGFAGTAPVGSFPAGASPYGALDMSGNVFEWIDDSNGEGRGVRGGSWILVPRFARASSRDWNDPRDRHGSIGLRCAQ